jgi:hypothetical protein
MLCEKNYICFFIIVQATHLFSAGSSSNVDRIDIDKETDEQVSRLADQFSEGFSSFFEGQHDSFKKDLYAQPSTDEVENDLDDYCFGVSVLKQPKRKILDDLELDEDALDEVKEDSRDVQREKFFELIDDEELSDIEYEAPKVSDTPVLHIPERLLVPSKGSGTPPLIMPFKTAETPVLKLPDLVKKTPINTARTVLHATPEDTLFTTTLSHDILASFLNILKTKGKGAKILVNAFFFTHESLAHVLVELKKKYGKDITIIVLVDKMSEHSSRKTFDILKDSGIPIYVYQSKFRQAINHCKYIAWSYLNEKHERLYRVISGSLNFTHMASDQDGNFEHVVFKRITEEEFKQYKRQMFEAIKNSKVLNEDAALAEENQLTNSMLEPNDMLLSPSDKVETYFSPVDDVMQTIIDRIQNTGIREKELEKDEVPEKAKIYIVSYALDVVPLMKALMAAHKRGVEIHIILDKYALKNVKESVINELKKLKNSGIDLSIYDNGYVLKNHGKFVFIADGQDRMLCGQGSYNFTESSKKSLNQFDWVPASGARTIYEQVKNEFGILIQKTKSLEQAISDVKEEQAKAAERKKKKKEAATRAKQKISSEEAKNIFPFRDPPSSSSSSSSMVIKK